MDEKATHLKDARELWRNLRGWVSRGGFRPYDDYGLRVADRYMRLFCLDR